MTPYKVAAKLGQAIGNAGPPNAKAQEVLSKYIITDMYAKAVQGMPAEEAVKWAEAELKKVYSPEAGRDRVTQRVSRPWQ